MAEAATVQITNADGKKRLTVYRLSSGTYQFTELTWRDGDEYSRPFWSVTYWSGMYATSAEAEADARQTLPWLRDRNPD